jgi:23S rRNA pseudouridine2605 synthase
MIPTVFALHKPVGIVCDLSVSAPPNTFHHRHKDLKTWFDSLAPNLRHVGRLDKKTTGLLLAVSSSERGGALTHRLLTPGNVCKTYVARCKCPANLSQASDNDEVISLLLKETALPDGPAKFDTVEILSRKMTTFGKHEKHECAVRVTIRIGRNRIVRRLCAALGFPVNKLERTAIGSLRLADIEELSRAGSSCCLDKNQVALLFANESGKGLEEDAKVKSTGKESEKGLVAKVESDDESRSKKRQRVK